MREGCEGGRPRRPDEDAARRAREKKRPLGEGKSEKVRKWRGGRVYESEVVDLNLYLSFRLPVNFQLAPWTTSFLLFVVEPNSLLNEP